MLLYITIANFLALGIVFLYCHRIFNNQIKIMKHLREENTKAKEDITNLATAYMMMKADTYQIKKKLVDDYDAVISTMIIKATQSIKNQTKKLDEEKPIIPNIIAN